MSFDATEWSLSRRLYLSRGLHLGPEAHDVPAAQQDKAPRVEFSCARGSQLPGASTTDEKPVSRGLPRRYQADGSARGRVPKHPERFHSRWI
jgi:hypothetical protein